MAHNIGVFVDVSNLFYSAKSAGVEVNYCRLLEYAVGGATSSAPALTPAWTPTTPTSGAS